MSLGLALYLLWSGHRHRGEADGSVTEPRPDGPLIWFHAPDPAAAEALAEIWPVMRQRRSHLRMHITGAGNPLSSDTPAAARAFLDHWQPTLAVLAGAALPAALITEAHRRDIPIFLIDTGGTVVIPGSPRLLGAVRPLMQRLTRVLAQDERRAAQFRRRGVRGDRITVMGRVEASPPTLSCTEAERAALSQGIRNRLVWLAAAVPPQEEVSILAAHSTALRLSHRLLLIFVPSDPARGPAIAAEAEAQGLSAALRSREDDPDDEDQVYVADTEGEFGLWYRLAQICFLGGTLIGEGPLRHPLEPAALGAAILHGPRGGAHQDMLARLDAAMAARQVSGVVGLCDAIGDLRAPDRVALMAHNAWAIASSGADVAERVAETLLAALPAPEAA